MKGFLNAFDESVSNALFSQEDHGLEMVGKAFEVAPLFSGNCDGRHSVIDRECRGGAQAKFGENTMRTTEYAEYTEKGGFLTKIELRKQRRKVGGLQIGLHFVAF